jgi:hypothetical protein
MSGTITPNGFESKSFQQCRDDLVNLFRETWHDINTDSASPSGHVIDILSVQESYIWQALQEIYNSASPSRATGMALDFLADQNGLTRFQHERADALLWVFYASSDAINLPIAWQIASEINGWIFETDSEHLLDLNFASVIFIQAESDFGEERKFQLDDGMPLISVYQVNEFSALEDLKDELESRGYLCTIHAANNPPDIDFDWKGKPTLEIMANPARSLMADEWNGFKHLVLAKRINAYREIPTRDAIEEKKLNRIMKKIDGVLNAYNISSTGKGRIKETDSELYRRIVHFRIGGLATLDAIQFNLLNGVLGVTFARVSQKFDTPFGVSGSHINCIHVLIDGGNESDIMASIARTKAAGIPTLKTSSATQGGYFEETDEYIWFDRPQNIEIQLRVLFSLNQQEATVAGFTSLINQDFIDFLQKSQDAGSVIVANKFLSVLYKYPGFGASWCHVRKKESTEWEKELNIQNDERPILNYDDIVWEQRI